MDVVGCDSRQGGCVYMKNFYRALREAWRHWLTLSLGIMCSFVMAFLWGANIIALFPIIETTIHGDTLQTWNKKRTETVRDKVAALTSEVDALVLPAPTDDNYLSVRLKRDLLQTKLMAEQVSLSSRERLQPVLEAWLPTDPFNTVILVLVLVVAGTLLKQIFGMANVVLVNYVSQSIAREIRMRIFSKAVTMDRAGFNHLGISGFMASSPNSKYSFW